MNPERMHKADFVTALVLITFGVTVLTMSFSMPDLSEKGINPYTAPGVVPAFLGGIITFFALILLVRSIMNKGYQLGEEIKEIPKALKRESFLRLGATLLLSLIYAAGLVGRINYVLATIIFIVLFVLTFELRGGMGRRELLKTILWALVLAVVVSVITAATFQYAFLVDLP